MYCKTIYFLIMTRSKLLKLFFEDVKEEIRTENNYWNYTYALISVKVKDIVYQCEVDYYMNNDELEILKIYNIDVLEADRENNFKNIIELLNKNL